MLVLDGGFQPLSVGGDDDAAAGEEAEHDCCCCIVGTSDSCSLGQGEVQVGESMQGLDLGRVAHRYVRQWNDKQRARVLAALTLCERADDHFALPGHMTSLTGRRSY